MKKDTIQKYFALLLKWSLVFAAIESSAALPGQAPSMKDLVTKAPLIFEGKVINVAAKNSLPTEQNPKGLPHTFVTYEVITPIRGKVGQTFTLRFLGGPNPDGVVMELSTYPHFDLGDHDLVLVTQNNESGCPLVSCEEGRLRIVKDRVYSDGGNVLRKGQNGIPTMGSAQPLKEVLTRTIVHPTTGQKVVVETKGSKLKSPKPEKDQFKRNEIITWIRSTVANLPNPQPVPTANIQNEFKGVSILAVAPKQETAPPARPPAQNPDDANEEKQLEANDGNPVLN